MGDSLTCEKLTAYKTVTMFACRCVYTRERKRNTIFSSKRIRSRIETKVD